MTSASANLDAYLDYAIRDAMGVPEVLKLLRAGQVKEEVSQAEDNEQ